MLYIGSTNDLDRRVFEHKQGLIEGFTKKYRVTRLVYVEELTDPQIWSRASDTQGMDQKQKTRADPHPKS